MKIAQVAPLYESVPPRLYGGTERVVSYLTEELAREGHQVTLFASGDSVTRANLVAPCPRALRLDERCVDQLAAHILMLDEVASRADEFDVVHFHVDYMHFPLSKQLGLPHVTTLHGRLNIPDLERLYRRFSEMPVVSISDAQRAPLPHANWQGTVYHGLPRDLYAFRPVQGKYLVFLGRISPEKRVDRAIRIAQHLGIPLKIAAKVDRVDREYFESIKPLLADPLVEFVGEISDAEKNDFVGNAMALLLPIDWPEPFGLVMIEAMACGSPVVAWREGSVPEVVDDGVTGFVVDSERSAMRAAEMIPVLDRRRCREIFEARFTAERMAHDYLAIYREIIAARRGQRTPRGRDRRGLRTPVLTISGRNGHRQRGESPDRNVPAAEAPQ